VQRNLLPAADLRAGGWESCYHYAPLGPVSGDYCDLIPSDGGLFFVLGDVSGKGVAASMLMTQLHALFRSLTRLSLPLDQVVIQANRVFCESALAGHYATLVCGQAKASGEVQIFNAGHLPAIVVQHGEILRIDSTGLPLGMFCELSVSETRLQMDPGDLLFLYTDGFSEARHSDEEYGVDRIANLVCNHDGRPPKEVIAACLNDLDCFVDGPAFDDVTLLAMQRTI
jgi:sigma-B regulation protein RsbU (phosphoserine phosphatase)